MYVHYAYRFKNSFRSCTPTGKLNIFVSCTVLVLNCSANDFY